MEVKTSGVSKPLQVLVDFRHRPFCLESFPSSCSLCPLETGSILQRQGYFQMCMTDKKRICFSPIFSKLPAQSSSSLEAVEPHPLKGTIKFLKSKTKNSFFFLAQSFDRSSHVNFDNTSMANPVLVPSVTKVL